METLNTEEAMIKIEIVCTDSEGLGLRCFKAADGSEPTARDTKVLKKITALVAKLQPPQPRIIMLPKPKIISPSSIG